jgi:alkanesulfonate monooxygenase SsuD/methylene tetrahydromethanopterin reductase-like flavin-dependent oxidoreductase (luciferase family)
MIKPWVFEFFTVLGDDADASATVQRWAEAYRWYPTLWSRLEEIGFHGLFFSEHHFMSGRLSPAPNLLIAHMAARTQQLRMGVMGMVAPLYEPWRLAEEIAMLDHLTQGRLEIGLSSGTGPMEFKAVGMKPEEIRPRFAEILTLLPRLLVETQHTHEGQFWQLNNLTISPRPLQQPMPPVWITGISTQTAALAAQSGFKFCSAFVSTLDMKKFFDAYRDALAALGRVHDADNLGLRRMIYVSDDDSEGREVARQTVARWRAIMSDGGTKPDAIRPKDVAPDAPNAKGPAAHAQTIGDEEAIGGNPATVAEQIIEQCRAVGAGHILGYTFGPLSRQQLERNYALWGEVIPVLRRANVC